MFLSRDEARALDRRAIEEIGIPGAVLMENAGRGMAELLAQLGIRGRVVICCGRGNNGGDGFVIARHLDALGFAVRVLLFADPNSLAGDAALNYRIAVKGGLSVEAFHAAALDEARLRQELAGADWIVDALFGSGQQGPLRPPFDRIVEMINGSGARVFAVDIPSGLDADTGQPLGATIRAAHTAVIVAPRTGFARPESRAWTGEVHVIGLGLPRALLPGGLPGGERP
jgi:NAD(P)H-hydrate epimerase